MSGIEVATSMVGEPRNGSIGAADTSPPGSASSWVP